MECLYKDLILEYFELSLIKLYKTHILILKYTFIIQVVIVSYTFVLQSITSRQNLSTSFEF